MPAQARITPEISVEQYRRDAARLLKALKAGDAAALARFTVLDNPPAAPQLKHALAVVAREAGFDGWTALKTAREGLDFTEFFGAPRFKDSLNAWFASYDEGKAHHRSVGGVLLPYRHHVFVTSLDILPRLGFAVDDPDWAEIGYDFVQPASSSAYERIAASLRRRFGA